MDHGCSYIFYANGDCTSTDVVQAALGRVDASVICFGDCDACLTSIRSGSCRLLVTNVPEPAEKGIALLTNVKRTAPWVPVIMLVERGRIDIAVRAMKAGATDCIERPPQTDRLLTAVNRALRNPIAELRSKPLTDIEQNVLQLIMEGKTNGQVATALHRSRRTVEVHRADIMRKLGARHIVDLVRNAALAGLVHM
jgi:FixJ family two-component response regulator